MSREESSMSYLIVWCLVVAALNNPLWTDKKDALLTAKQVGLVDVTTTGYGWFDCSLDVFSTKIRGTNVRGEPVRATVCHGFLSNSYLVYENK